jgi:hypothetical protein
MRRTTIYLEPELEILLKLEAMRRRQPMAELLREALRSYLKAVPQSAPPGAGAFDSGHCRTAEDAEKSLEELGFGEETA